VNVAFLRIGSVAIKVHILVHQARDGQHLGCARSGGAREGVGGGAWPWVIRTNLMSVALPVENGLHGERHDGNRWGRGRVFYLGHHFRVFAGGLGNPETHRTPVGRPWLRHTEEGGRRWKENLDAPLACTKKCSVSWLWLGERVASMGPLGRASSRTAPRG
jgi:hypothetical protein